MTNKYEELREALEKATPGDWIWDQIGTYSAPGGCAVLWPDYSKSGVRYRRLDYQGGFTKHDANFITNAKRIVPALLSSHDAQAAEIDRLQKALKDLSRAYVNLMESDRDRIISLGGERDPVSVMELNDPYLRDARAAIARATGEPT